MLLEDIPTYLGDIGVGKYALCMCVVCLIWNADMVAICQNIGVV